MKQITKDSAFELYNSKQTRIRQLHMRQFHLQLLGATVERQSPRPSDIEASQPELGCVKSTQNFLTFLKTGATSSV